MAMHKMKTTVTLTHPGFFAKDTEVYFSQNQILSYLAAGVVRAAGIQRAVLDLPSCLRDASELMSKLIDVKIQEGSAKQIVGIIGTKLTLLEEIVDFVVHNTAVARLNKRNGELYPKEYSNGTIDLDISQEYQDENEEIDNFTDLGALTRNIINNLIYDHQIVQR